MAAKMGACAEAAQSSVRHRLKRAEEAAEQHFESNTGIAARRRTQGNDGEVIEPRQQRGTHDALADQFEARVRICCYGAEPGQHNGAGAQTMPAGWERCDFSGLSSNHPTRDQIAKSTAEFPVDRACRAIRRDVAEYADDIGIGANIGDAAEDDIDIEAGRARTASGQKIGPKSSSLPRRENFPVL